MPSMRQIDEPVGTGVFAVARATAWLCAACACGCASAPSPAPSAGPSGPPPPAPAQAAPAYDWHPLIVVPFGTLLKDMPLALDEVLMFRDAAGRGPAEPAAAGAPNDPESGDCFSIDGASPPQFLARRPDSYLLCFEHDRLRRIEASVHLAEAEAEPLLGALCAQWLGRVQDTARTPDGCAGRDGAIEWRVRSAQDPGSSAILSITLIDARPEPRE
jgi:hypothetical protein